MQIVCEREKFSEAFQTAASVAPQRSPKPILQNVKLEVGDQGTVLMATDLEVGVRINVQGVDVQTGGTAVLPVGQFGSILRESTDEKLHIESDDKGTLVRGDRSEFKLPSANPDEFPAVASFDDEKCIEVSAGLFAEMIRRTEFATDPESSRYALGGVLLELEGDKMIAVGTDGRRLAKMEGPAKLVAGYEVGETMTIVPTRTVKLIQRALTNPEANVQLAVRANDILIRSDGMTVYSRLVEGRFPKWRDVLPRRQDATRIELTIGPIYAALRQAAIVASKESRGIDFKFSEGSVVLNLTTAEVGQSRIELPVSYDGAEISITLDHQYLGDFLRVLDPDKTFTLDVENADQAALCTTDDGYGYVVMPLARDR